MTVDDAIALLDQLLQPEGLNDLQASVFRHCWQGEGYQDIADQLGYDSGYIRTVGSRLWKQLSDLLEKKVTKSNLHQVLEQASHLLTPQTGDASVLPEFPSLPLNFQSPFYIERFPQEQRCRHKIDQPGALIRIQGPKQMGKTSLLYQILGYARSQDYATLRLSCQEATAESFNTVDGFLRWFCQSMARKLKLPPNLETYWHDDPSFAKSNCTDYMENYLLSELDAPLVLGLDDVERIFTYPHIAQDFFPLLRLWHEEANETEIWQNLRLVVVHSTEVYVPLDIHQSPFNVGLPIQLGNWTLEQVQELALRYQLQWATEPRGQAALSRLLEQVGGHPYLIQLALYHLWEYQNESPLTQLEAILQTAATDAGIYGSHLRRLLTLLERSPELSQAMTQVVNSEEPVAMMAAYQLQSMGLVELVGDSVRIPYPIYYDYFRSRLNHDS